MYKLKRNQGKWNYLKSRCIVMTAATMLFTFSGSTPVLAANKISESPLGKGLVNMANDVSTFLLVLSPVVGGAFALYFLIRKNGADEQDQKQWNKRLINTGICTVGAVLVTALITLVTGYFI